MSKWFGAKLVHTAISIGKFIVISWKLDNSSTTLSSSFISSISENKGVPIFPPTQVLYPSCSNILDIIVVVVVFPSLPVIPYILALQYLTNSSISEVIYAPSFLTLIKASLSILIDGVLNTTSNPVRFSKYFSPSSSFTPLFLNSVATSPNCSSVFLSKAVTSAPNLTRKLIRGILLTPIPTTATFFLYMNSLNFLKSSFIICLQINMIITHTIIY